MSQLSMEKRLLKMSITDMLSFVITMRAFSFRYYDTSVVSYRYLDFKHFLFNTVSPSIRFMRFLNRNAYIMCAMKGSNFCVSAKDAFNLLMRNIVRVVVLNGIVNFLLFIGKLVIVVGVGTLSYFFFRYHSYIT